jgi:hypothetical protein
LAASLIFTVNIRSSTTAKIFFLPCLCMEIYTPALAAYSF